MSALCFVDCETTSLRPDRRVWEVAMIRRDDGLSDVTAHFFIEVDLADADPFALKVGRFYERHPLGQRIAGSLPTAYDVGQYEQDEMPGDVLTEIDAALKVAEITHGATLVGSNPSFDAETLSTLLRENRLTPSWSHRLRDVATLASGHLRRDVGGLDGALEALGIPLDETERHTALGDAHAARDVYDYVLGGEQ